MAQTSISNAAAIVACNAVVDLLDAGAAAGYVRIYDGTQPANVDTAITTQDILSEHTLTDPAFGAAADANPGGRATANPVVDDTSANKTSLATWYRAFDSNGIAVIDGSCGLTGSGADMILNN